MLNFEIIESYLIDSPFYDGHQSAMITNDDLTKGWEWWHLEFHYCLSNSSHPRLITFWSPKRTDVQFICPLSIFVFAMMTYKEQKAYQQDDRYDIDYVKDVEEELRIIMYSHEAMRQFDDFKTKCPEFEFSTPHYYASRPHIWWTHAYGNIGNDSEILFEIHFNALDIIDTVVIRVSNDEIITQYYDVKEAREIMNMELRLHREDYEMKGGK